MNAQSMNELPITFRALVAICRAAIIARPHGEAVMTQYRCQYMLGDRVQGVKMIACPSDADMMIQANDLLAWTRNVTASKFGQTLDWLLVCRARRG